MQINTIHKIDEAKLEMIIEEMKAMGEPVIRYVETSFGAMAIEGCHRMEAAYRLGLEPELIEVDMDDEIEDHGFQDYEGEVLTVSDIVEMVGIPTGNFYNF